MDRFLEGRRILVLEDDYFAALDVQQMVEALGGIVAGPVGRLDQAQRLARAQPLDGALLDVQLGKETSYPLARELLDAGIVVIFLTGYEPGSIDAEFREVPRVSKPIDGRLGACALRTAFA